MWGVSQLFGSYNRKFRSIRAYNNIKSNVEYNIILWIIILPSNFFPETIYNKFYHSLEM